MSTKQTASIDLLTASLSPVPQEARTREEVHYMFRVFCSCGRKKCISICLGDTPNVHAYNQACKDAKVKMVEKGWDWRNMICDECNGNADTARAQKAEVDAMTALHSGDKKESARLTALAKSSWASAKKKGAKKETKKTAPKVEKKKTAPKKTTKKTATTPANVAALKKKKTAPKKTTKKKTAPKKETKKTADTTAKSSSWSRSKSKKK